MLSPVTSSDDNILVFGESEAFNALVYFEDRLVSGQPVFGLCPATGQCSLFGAVGIISCWFSDLSQLLLYVGTACCTTCESIIKQNVSCHFHQIIVLLIQENHVISGVF